jgi:hypothetical protein
MSASSSNQVKRTTEKEQEKLFSYSLQIYPGMNFSPTTTSNANDNLCSNFNNSNASNVVQLTDLKATPDDLNRSEMQIQIQNQELDEYKKLEEKMEKKMVLIISLITIIGIIGLAIGLIVSQK